MFSDKRKIWIKAGYSEFAKKGPNALNVELLSSLIGKSRSSFYHLFGDIEGFRDDLYEHHLEYADVVAKKLSKITDLHPGFTGLMAANKDFIFVHVQLYNHREMCEKCGQTFNKSASLVAPRTAAIWAGSAGFKDMHPENVKDIYGIVRDSFFSGIIYDQYSQEFLHKLIIKLNQSIRFLGSEARPR